VRRAGGRLSFQREPARPELHRTGLKSALFGSTAARCRALRGLSTVQSGLRQSSLTV